MDMSLFDKKCSNFYQAVNTRGPFLGMKYAIAQMMKQEPRPSGDRGWVVNIASIGGLVGLSMERKESHCPLIRYQRALN